MRWMAEGLDVMRGGWMGRRKGRSGFAPRQQQQSGRPIDSWSRSGHQDGPPDWTRAELPQQQDERFLYSQRLKDTPSPSKSKIISKKATQSPINLLHQLFLCSSTIHLTFAEDALFFLSPYQSIVLFSSHKKVFWYAMIENITGITAACSHCHNLQIIVFWSWSDFLRRAEQKSHWCFSSFLRVQTKQRRLWSFPDDSLARAEDDESFFGFFFRSSKMTAPLISQHAYSRADSPWCIPCNVCSVHPWVYCVPSEV